MVIKNKKFIYNAFFRTNPPSILRLAWIELVREGVDFNKESKSIIWNLVWDRAERIVKCISKTREAKLLHKRLINERTL